MTGAAALVLVVLTGGRSVLSAFGGGTSRPPEPPLAPAQPRPAAPALVLTGGRSVLSASPAQPRPALVAAAQVAGTAGAVPPCAPRATLVRAERTEARLGEPFAYEIDLRHAPDEAWRLAGDLDAPPFRGAARGCRRADAPSPGEARTTCTLSLALFAIGPHDVPAVTLVGRTPAGEETLAVPGPRITGVGIIDPAAPPERLALRAPAPPVPLLVPSLRVLAWAAGALALVAAALLARRAWRARARAVAEPPPPEPPDARLRRRLDDLEARGLAARGLGREHVFEVSAIVREWIGAVTGVPALDLTTAELVERLRLAGDPRLDVEALRRFCEACDLVKFARAPTGPEDCAAAVAFARRLAP